MAKGAGAWISKFRNGYRVYYRKEPGGPQNGTREIATFEEAERIAEELRALVNRKRRTIGDGLEAYEKDMEARGLRSGKKILYRLRILLGELEASPLAVLTPKKADDLYTALAESKKYGVKTHHVVLESVKAFGAWCAHPRRRWLRENPFERVEKIGERADHRSESLRVDEARTFREQAVRMGRTGDVGAVAALLALVTSLRPSEIVQIQARDVDDGGAILWIDGARVKTHNTRRPIEVVDEDLRALLVKFADDKAPTDRIVPRKADFVAESAKRVAAAAGVPSVTARELRRTFASLAARRGRSLDDVAFSLGHGADASARVAKQHYIAPGAREAGTAGRVLGVLQGGKSEKQRR